MAEPTERPMDLYGQALWDYYYGKTDAVLMICRDDGVETPMPLEIFFRSSVALPIDRLALDQCRGRILDIGAGTGLHSLHLQSRGFSVRAVDISAAACEIMWQRGVKEVRCVDITQGETPAVFDTLLLLGRSIGIVGTLQGLERFLGAMHQCLRPEGQILLNSLDVRCTTEAVHVEYQRRNEREGRYRGEIRMRFAYAGQQGPLFPYLHVDPETLTIYAAKHGWQCAILQTEPEGDFLAQLTARRNP
jgi:SAM-dependent methyltransferase